MFGIAVWLISIGLIVGAAIPLADAKLVGKPDVPPIESCPVDIQRLLNESIGFVKSCLE